MLDILVAKRGRVVSREELGEAVEMEHTGGTFSAYLSDLKQAGLILVDRDGVRANQETLLLYPGPSQGHECRPSGNNGCRFISKLS